MIGAENPNEPKLYYRFSLEKKIRPDHPLRKLKQLLRLDFIESQVRGKYGSNGNVSIPPTVILKMMILLVLYNVRSERELMATIPERLDWLWFLGYDIDSDVPNHSVLSKARKRWGEAVFQELFLQVVRQAVEAGLVDGNKIFVDASMVEADASNNSVKKLEKIQEVEQYQELLKRLEDRGRDGIGEYGQVNRTHISSTDPDASLGREKGRQGLYYKVHRSVDEANEIITTCDVTTGAVNEAHVLAQTVKEHEAAVGKEVKTVVADSKYGTGDNYRELKQMGKCTHMKDLAACLEPRHADVFGKERFEYVEGRDVYVCPAGKELVNRGFNRRRRWYKYRIDKRECAGCELRDQCTKDKNGRSLSRVEGQELVDAGRRDAASEEGKADLHQRQHLMERSYANGKRYGYKRSRWRGLWRVRIQQWLVATVQNLMKMAKLLAPAGEGPLAVVKNASFQCVNRRFTGMKLAWSQIRFEVNGVLANSMCWLPSYLCL